MSAKILAVLVAVLLLGTTALASAQVVYAPYGYNYNYYGYVPAYPPALTLGPGVGPGIYYAPGYYNYAPAYVAPVYTGWNNVWNLLVSRVRVANFPQQPRSTVRLPSRLFDLLLHQITTGELGGTQRADGLNAAGRSYPVGPIWALTCTLHSKRERRPSSHVARECSREKPWR